MAAAVEREDLDTTEEDRDTEEEEEESTEDAATLEEEDTTADVKEDRAAVEDTTEDVEGTTMEDAEEEIGIITTVEEVDLTAAEVEDRPDVMVDRLHGEEDLVPWVVVAWADRLRRVEIGDVADPGAGSRGRPSSAIKDLVCHPWSRELRRSAGDLKEWDFPGNLEEAVEIMGPRRIGLMPTIRVP